MFTLTSVCGDASVGDCCGKKLDQARSVAGHPGATMHNSAAIGQCQSGERFLAVNRVTVSDLITFIGQTGRTKAEGYVLGALAQATKG
jgi:hypothetical protein